MGEMVQRTPEQSLVASIRSDQFREQVAMALPPSVTEDRFVRVACSAILANPDIAKLDHASLLRAMIQAAADGLMPNGYEAAFVPRKGKAVYTPMIGGYRKIAAEHGWTLRTAVVYDQDEFRHGVVDGVETLNHFPVRPGAERGELIAAYAIATHGDGRRMMAVLHPADIAKRRASAATQEVWTAHPAAMWEKSAGRDLFAQLPLPETDLVRRVVRAEDLDPDEAARGLYGPGPTSLPALPADEAGQAGAGSQPAGGATSAAALSPTDAAASASPEAGDTFEDEPSLEGDEPGEAAAADDAAFRAAADQGAMFHPPNGKYAHLSLSEIHQSGDKGVDWLLFMLRKRDQLRPAAYREAVWGYCRVYAPALYQQVLAELETAS